MSSEPHRLPRTARTPIRGTGFSCRSRRNVPAQSTCHAISARYLPSRWPTSVASRVIHLGMQDVQHPSVRQRIVGAMALTPTPSVLELIDARLRGESDNYRLALALEGGGMRGVVSASMMMGFRDIGIDKVIDRFYGTSSGSLNLAYFAGGATWPEVGLYYDHLTQGFVRKIYRYPHKPTLDMSFAFEEIMERRRPINVEALVASSYDVRIVLADVDALEPKIVSLHDVAGELNQYLQAGSWLPLLSGPPLVLHGRRYLDGGVLWPDPLYAAIDEGCTHVLCINTAAGDAGSEHSKRARFALRLVLNRWAHGLGDRTSHLVNAGIAIRLRFRSGRQRLSMMLP